MPEPMLAIAGVNTHIGQYHILQGVDFEVPRGGLTMLLGRNGAVNGLLRALGIADAPAELIYNFTGVMIGMTHALMPLAILTMVAVMESIDPNLSRAATTLGARGGQAFWRIYFPLSLPGVAAAGLLVFITALGFFITPAILGSPQNALFSQLIVIQVTTLLAWGRSGAMAVVLLLATLLILGLAALVTRRSRRFAGDVP